MNYLINRNYQSIVDRGLIAPDTPLYKFWMKLEEEVQELIDAQSLEEQSEELADVILTCLNFAKHYDIDIESELYRKVEINENRAKNN